MPWRKTTSQADRRTHRARHREWKSRLLPLPAAGRSTPPRRMPPLQHYVGIQRARHARVLLTAPRAIFSAISSLARRLFGSLVGRPHVTGCAACVCSNRQPPRRTDRWSTACQVTTSPRALDRAGSGHLIASVASGMCCDILLTILHFRHLSFLN
jgi:hypothetical protein